MQFNVATLFVHSGAATALNTSVRLIATHARQAAKKEFIFMMIIYDGLKISELLTNLAALASASNSMLHKFGRDFCNRLNFHGAIKNFRALGLQTDCA